MTADKQRVAIVTGAGRGIGRAIALELARAGFALALAARSRDELEETRRLSRLAPRLALIVLIDLAQEEAPDALIETVISHFGGIDVLVNNAGWAPSRSALVKISGADQDRMIALNLRAPIALSRLAAAAMEKQGGGAIINVASDAARKTPAGEAIYSAAKAGLVAFGRACFAELRQSGIKVSTIIPGLVDTALIPQNKRLDREAMLTPADVAAAVMQIVNAPPNVCPAELVLEPQREPERGR